MAHMVLSCPALLVGESDYVHPLSFAVVFPKKNLTFLALEQPNSGELYPLSLKP